MAVVTGMQEITSGERASEGFDFNGGRCGYMVIDVPNTTPDWDLEMLPPGATSWQKMNANSDQVDSAKAYDSTGSLPAGRYRLHCDTTVVANYSPVSLFWCYVPATMADAALF